VWERFLSRWFYQDCAWWQSSLSCWLVEARRIFLHDIEADPRVGIPIGEEAGRSKGSHPFLDTCLTTESSPSFTFKTRHLGDSEMMVSRIPRLWSVKTAWFWAQQRETERTGLCCAFRPPRGSKCSSDAPSVKNVSASMLPVSRRDPHHSCKALIQLILRSYAAIRPSAATATSTSLCILISRSQHHLSIAGEAAKS
jgi:hypothetical protein